MKDKKKIIPVVALIVVVIAVIGIAFQPNYVQVLDNVVTDRYYDTAQKAYQVTDDYFTIKEDIATINLSDRFAIWFAVTDEDELLMAKMAVNNGKYFSLGSYGVYSKKTLNQTSKSLEEEMSLDKDTLKFTILPLSKYKESDYVNEAVKTEKFNFDNTSYAFIYQILFGEE